MMQQGLHHANYRDGRMQAQEILLNVDKNYNVLYVYLGKKNASRPHDSLTIIQ
jgi:hypothetical protein